MIRAIGAVLIAAGGAWFGLTAAEKLRRQERALEDMLAGLVLLEQELELGGLKLGQLMDKLADQTKGAARAVFGGCGAELQRLDHEEFSVLWKRVLASCMELGKEEQAALEPLGSTLGRCDSAEACEVTAGVRKRLEELRSRVEEERRNQGKLCQTLGVTGGAFLAILLL